MPGQSSFYGNLTPGAATVGDEQVDANRPLGVTKNKHTYSPGTNFALAIGGTPATREEIVFVATSAGVIRSFRATLNDRGTSTNIDFTLKKNGVSVLSAAVNFTHADADKTVKTGTLSDTAVAAGDIFSIAMTVTSATGAQGPFAEVGIAEDNAP